MTPDRTNQTKGNNHHHQQRPAVGAEHPGQYQVDQHHCQHRTALHISQGFTLVSLTSFEGKTHAVASLKFRQCIGVQVGDNSVVVVDGVIDVAGHGKHQFALDMAD